EIGENLRTDSDFLLQRPLREMRIVAGNNTVFRPQAWTRLMQVNEDTLTGFRDTPERVAHEGGAIAPRGPEEIPICTVRVHPHEHICLAGDVSTNQNSVRFRADVARIDNGPEITELGRYRSLGAAMNVLFVLQPVPDQLGNRDHPEAMASAKFLQMRHARH